VVPYNALASFFIVQAPSICGWIRLVAAMPFLQNSGRQISASEHARQAACISAEISCTKRRRSTAGPSSPDGESRHCTKSQWKCSLPALLPGRWPGCTTALRRKRHAFRSRVCILLRQADRGWPAPTISHPRPLRCIQPYPTRLRGPTVRWPPARYGRSSLLCAFQLRRDYSPAGAAAGPQP
jgi:hypothetical protein